MKSKLWKFLTLVMLISFVLVACQPSPAAPATATTAPEQPVVEPTATTAPEQPAAATDTPAAPAESPTPEPTAVPPTITVPAGATKVTIFVGFGTGTSPEQQAVHKKIQEAFNSTHDNLKIEFLTVPWAERITKFSTMLAGGMSPDIVMPIGVGGISEFYDEWLDLTPFIEKDKYDMTRFVGKTVEIHNYPTKGVLGLPMCVYPSAVFYNTDLFDAAGVEYPPHKWGDKYADGTDWTYDKLVEIAKKLTIDANGNDANSPAFDPKNIKQFGWDGWDWMNVFDVAKKFGAENGTGVSTDGRKSLLMTPEYLAAATWIKDTIWTWHIRANSEQAGAFYDKAGDPFGSGLVAMWEIHSWMSYAWPSWTKAFNWDIAADPNVVGQPIISIVDADTAVMPKSSKNQEAAWEVMKWFYENKQLAQLIANYGCLPADKDLSKSWVTDRKAENPNVDYQVFIDAMAYTTESPNHEAWKPNYTKINDVISKAFEQINTGQNLDVQAVFGAADKEVQALLDDYWKNK